MKHADGARAQHTMTTPAGVVTFMPQDIYSKFGFADGDLLDDVLDDWGRSQGLDPSGGDWRLLDAHWLLWHAYHRFVARPGWEPVLFSYTAHNPVRAVSEWDDTAVAGLPDDACPVRVPVSDLFSLCRELFPVRSRPWLQLHHALHSAWEFSPPAHPAFVDIDLDAPPGPQLQHSAHVRATDALCAFYQLTRDEMTLLARLLTQQRPVRDRSASGGTPPAELEDLVAVSRLAAGEPGEAELTGQAAG